MAERQSSPTPEEAAAIVAAVERFLRDHAASGAAPEAVDPWRRAALLEGVGRGSTPGEDPDPWINT
jgi:hypothetical protein